MRQGRWYPTQVELADGRTVVVAGYDESGAFPTRWNEDLEVFAPAAARGGRGQLTLHEPAGSIVSGPYPHLFTLPDGKVLLAGQDDATATGSPRCSTRLGWMARRRGRRGAQLGRIPWWAKASQAALLLGAPGSTPRVTVIGGYGRYQSPEDQITAVPNAATLAIGQATWTRGGYVPDQNVGRAYANLVELPDGMLVTIGGGSGIAPGFEGQNETGGDPELRQVELLRPGIDSTWTLGPLQKKWRTYHSTAVLLPDGRVLSAGDDYWSINNTPDPRHQAAGHAARPGRDLLPAVPVRRREPRAPPRDHLAAADGRDGRGPVRGAVRRRRDRLAAGRQGRARRAGRHDARREHEPAPHRARGPDAAARRPRGSGARVGRPGAPGLVHAVRPRRFRDAE